MPEPAGSSPTGPAFHDAPQPTPHPGQPTDPTMADEGKRPATSLGEQTTLGRYRILGPLGRGGMGFVFRAWHEGLQRAFALKVIQQTAETPPSQIERFVREARAVARLGKHPNVVQVHDAGKEGECWYIAMDLVEGESLDRRLRGRPLEPREAARIAHGAALGLAAAHAQGIIHRDLKPSNILLSQDGSPHVCDFGLARDASTGSAQAVVTRDGEILGTLHYMAPEQAAGDRSRIGPATDVYGLGATLYEMLTGRPPFTGANQFEVWSAIVGEEPAAPRSLEPSVPAPLEVICLKALEKDPSRRYADARAMAEDLERFLSGAPILARPVSAVTKLLWTASRRRTPLLSAAAASLVLAGSLYLVHWNRTRIARDLGAARDDGQRDQAAWRVAEEARLRAEREEAEAKEALRKAGLAQAVLARWALLVPTLAEMERDFFDSRVSKAERQRRGEAHWPAVAAFMKDTPDDPSSRATMLPLAGWARCLAGLQGEGLDWMDQARRLDGDLPYADVTEALVHFSRFLEEEQLPSTSNGMFGLEVGAAPPEVPEMRALRSQIEARLDAASKARVWGGGVGQEFPGLVGAIRAMQAGRYADAEKGFGEALGAAALAGFRADFLLARGKARYLLQRFDDAMADLDRVVEARPGMGEAYYFRGLVRAAKGDEALAAGKDACAAYGRALEDFDECLSRIPADYFALIARGTALTARARARERRGEDSRDDFDRAIAAYTEVLRAHPGDPTTRLDRGIAYQGRAEVEVARGEAPWKEFDLAAADLDASLTSADVRGPSLSAMDALENVSLQRGEAELTAGRDPRESLHRAAEMCDSVLKREPGSAETWMNRGLARACEADWLAANGHDPHDCWKMAYADFQKAVEKEPRLWHARANLGMLLVQEGRAEEAVKVYEEALAVRPGEPQILEGLARAKSMADVLKAPRPAWWEEMQQADRDVNAMKYAAGAKACEAAFAKVTDDQERNPTWRPLLAAAHYNLACAYAIRALGKADPGDAGKAVDPAVAASWRDKAFEQLRRARALGWNYLDHLRNDPDLVHLHDDPRWKDVLEEKTR